jgi:hypothetical protein
MDQGLVEDYADALRRGDTFPPVELVYDGEHYWLTDGFHRLAAHQLLEREEVEAEVVEGTKRQAVWRSLAANAKHGKRRSRADKRRAIKRVLRDEEWHKKSDSMIARHLGVSQPTVSKYRRQLEGDPTYKFYKSDERIGADGRKINTTNIGTSKPALDPPPAPPAGAPDNEPAPERADSPRTEVESRGADIAQLVRQRDQAREAADNWRLDAAEARESKREMERRAKALSAKVNELERALEEAREDAASWKKIAVGYKQREIEARSESNRAEVKSAWRKLTMALHPDHARESYDEDAWFAAQRLYEAAGGKAG